MNHEDYMKLFDDEIRMCIIADELQKFMLSADHDTVEDFCGFPLDGITKKDAVYQVMCQMPDEVLLEYHEKYIH